MSYDMADGRLYEVVRVLVHKTGDAAVAPRGWAYRRNVYPGSLGTVLRFYKEAVELEIATPDPHVCVLCVVKPDEIESVWRPVCQKKKEERG